MLLPAVCCPVATLARIIYLSPLAFALLYPSEQLEVVEKYVPLPQAVPKKSGRKGLQNNIHLNHTNICRLAIVWYVANSFGR